MKETGLGSDLWPEPGTLAGFALVMSSIGLAMRLTRRHQLNDGTGSSR